MVKTRSTAKDILIYLSIYKVHLYLLPWDHPSPPPPPPQKKKKEEKKEKGFQKLMLQNDECIK